MSEPTNKDAKVYVAGHRGMVGSALVRRLKRGGYRQILTRTRDELNLLDQHAVHKFMRDVQPDIVYLAAARVGGIVANSTYPAEFIYENLCIETNIIHAALQANVKRLIFLGSSCIYPRDCPQPIRESYLLTGRLEPTNEPYAVAKIAGIQMCEAFNRQYGTRYLSLMPTNLYGPNDNYDLNNSHVIPALLRKVYEACRADIAELEVWGTGLPRREFLHVDDLADACVFAAERDLDGHLYNVGTGIDISISALAKLISDIAGFDGKITFDSSKPDGTPRKLLDVELLSAAGWTASIGLREGLTRTYEDFVDQRGRDLRGVSQQNSRAHGIC